jgi:lipoyl(octanoyl) transferase
MPMTICKTGLMPYDKALQLQYRLVGDRQKGLIGNTLLLVEHPPVITMGIRADPANIHVSREQLAAAGVPIHDVNRGGDVTYHGPGQIVGYPIFQLKDFPQGVRWFIQTLETALIDLLREQYQIEAYGRQDKYTGVWVGDRKIVAFGLAIRQGVSMHGFAFNVNTDLSHFNWINPCGLSLGVTSVANELGHPVDLGLGFDLVAQSIASHLNLTINWLDLASLQAAVSGPERTDGDG